MKRINKIALAVLVGAFLFNCESSNRENTSPEKVEIEMKRPVVYQMFTRLFGNTNQTNKPWGTLEENGVGKFNDINERALKELKDMGHYTCMVYRSAGACCID